jgi:CubicO group peptidase (beta-lactamase class C family)
MLQCAALLTLAACAGRPAEPRPEAQPAPHVSETPRTSLAAADWTAVRAFLDSALADTAAPGAVLAVSFRGEHRYYSGGRLGIDNPARPDSTTVYDLASLSKVIGLTTMMMKAVDEHRIELDAPIQRYVPAFQGAYKEQVTVRHLLTHSSGLPAWRALYREAADRASAMALADTTPLDTLPGVRMVYSDLGAIVLTQAIEHVYGTRIDSLLARRVFDSLGMTSTRYLPPAAWRDRIAPTENDPWRGHILLGEVHDENAARLDGVSGHAGLFSDARDLLVFADWLMSGLGAPGVHRPAGSPEPPASLRVFIRRQHLPPESSRALGWDTPSGMSSAGTLLDSTSFGHTGFTGTSIWVDAERGLGIVLLSNRVHPTRNNPKWGAVRRGIADRVVESLFPVAAQ